MKNQYDVFIDENEISNLINITEDKFRIRDILQKAAQQTGLTHEETALLCSVQSDELLNDLFDTASKIKQNIYGNRIVFFAPLYISNLCNNDCTYCAFRKSNKPVKRRTLTEDELKSEVNILLKNGHKRLILVFGETENIDANFISNTVKQVYSIKNFNNAGVELSSIRRVNINAAPLSVEDYKIVKSAGIGTYQVFQETYHRPTYEKVHPHATKKHDYYWRLFSMHRAQEAGIDDVGLGALFGLYDWRFEVISLVKHSLSLEKYFGVGPHTISFPRIEPAYNTIFTQHIPYEVSDNDFMKLIAILRLAVPYTGLILTCREDSNIRNKATKLGVSQIDAGSKIGIGGYTDYELLKNSDDAEQFKLGDSRSLSEVIDQLLDEDYIPSFCTACYRLGRTGEHFMAHAKPGFIKKFCQPNAIITFYEYLSDYAVDSLFKKGKLFIDKLIASLDDSDAILIKNKLNEIDQGKRDLFL